MSSPKSMNITLSLPAERRMPRPMSCDIWTSDFVDSARNMLYMFDTSIPSENVPTDATITVFPSASSSILFFA